MLVHGSTGRITFWYKQDRVLLQRAGHGPQETEYGRTDLLGNLVQHLTTGAELLVPPADTLALYSELGACWSVPKGTNEVSTR